MNKAINFLSISICLSVVLCADDKDKIKKEDPNAFTDSAIIKSYKIYEKSLDYNPMGGLMVTIIINDDEKLSLDFNLIDNGDGTYHSAYFGISPELGKLLGY